MLRDTAVRRGLAVIALALVILSIDLFFGFRPARADEETSKPVSAIVLSHCARTVGIVLTDEHGMLHPIPPEAMNEAVLAQLLSSIPQERRIVATVPCHVDTAI